jgi:hypothetical protein
MQQALALVEMREQLRHVGSTPTSRRQAGSDDLNCGGLAACTGRHHPRGDSGSG